MLACRVAVVRLLVPVMVLVLRVLASRYFEKEVFSFGI
jgi:hypothetical protein